MKVRLIASLYVMWRADTGQVKVGMSRSPSDRERQLGSAHVLAYATEGIKDADRVEQYAHALLHEKRTDVREYFTATFDEAKAAITEARRMVVAGEPLPPTSGKRPRGGGGRRHQINFLVDDEFIAAVVGLQRASMNDGRVPTMSDVIRQAVIDEAYDRGMPKVERSK